MRYAAVSHKQAVYLNPHCQISCFYKQNDQPSELSTPMLSTFASMRQIQRNLLPYTNINLGNSFFDVQLPFFIM